MKHTSNKLCGHLALKLKNRCQKSILDHGTWTITTFSGSDADCANMSWGGPQTLLGEEW